MSDQRQLLPDDQELIQLIETKLGGGWTTVASRRKLRKAIIELTNGADERIIAKVSGVGRGRLAYDILIRLYEAGFRPPSGYTVPQPLGYVEEHGLLIQEKAPGLPFADLLNNPERGQACAIATAQCMARLHNASIEVPPAANYAPRIHRWRTELAEVMPEIAHRVHRLADACEIGLSVQYPTVATHGDLHPKNIFFSDDARLTVIDFDTWGGRERAAELMYCGVQCGIIARLRWGNFAATSPIVRTLLRTYAAEVRCDPEPSRLVIYAGLTFLQSLHYQCCVLHDLPKGVVPEWLRLAETCVRRQNIDKLFTGE